MTACFDETILNWFQWIHNDIITVIFKVLTLLGEGGILWIAIGLFLVIKKKTRMIGVTVLAALVLCLIVGNITLKPLVARPRPCWIHPEIPLLIANPTDYSFPSGHAMSSFASAMAIILWNRRMGVAALVVAVFMSATRLYFYVHYPTDILAGMLIGIVLGIVSYLVVKKIKQSNILHSHKNML